MDSGEAGLQRAALRMAMLRAMSRAMAADRVLADDEVETIRRLYHQLSGIDLPAETVRAEGRRRVGQELSTLASRMQEPERRQVLRAACVVAYADGRIGDGEREVLDVLAEELRLGSGVVTLELARLEQQTQLHLFR